MPLQIDTKIAKNPNANTLYVTIPAVMAQDSAFPFREGSNVTIEIVTEEKSVSKGMIVIRKSELGTATRRK